MPGTRPRSLLPQMLQGQPGRSFHRSAVMQMAIVVFGFQAM